MTHYKKCAGQHTRSKERRGPLGSELPAVWLTEWRTCSTHFTIVSNLSTPMRCVSSLRPLTRFRIWLLLAVLAKRRSVSDRYTKRTMNGAGPRTLIDQGCRNRPELRRNQIKHLPSRPAKRWPHGERSPHPQPTICESPQHGWINWREASVN